MIETNGSSLAVRCCATNHVVASFISSIDPARQVVPGFGREAPLPEGRPP
jgi:hypothetical protein